LEQKTEVKAFRLTVDPAIAAERDAPRAEYDKPRRRAAVRGCIPRVVGVGKGALFDRVEVLLLSLVSSLILVRLSNLLDGTAAATEGL
jgi:hypothetical protein